MSSTKHSSICSGGKNGNPKNSDNHFPISHVFSLYSVLNPRSWILRHQFCPRWNLQQSIFVPGNTRKITLCIACSKSIWIECGVSVRFLCSQSWNIKNPSVGSILNFFPVAVHITVEHNFHFYISMHCIHLANKKYIGQLLKVPSTNTSWTFLARHPRLDVQEKIAIPLSTSFINRQFSDSFEDKWLSSIPEIKKEVYVNYLLTPV